MPECSTSVSTQIQDGNQNSPISIHDHISNDAENFPLHIQDGEADCKLKNDNEIVNVDEYEDEDEGEDADFNPFLKEVYSVEASSSLSSEVEGMDTDVSDSGIKKAVVFLNNSTEKHLGIGDDYKTIGYVEHDDEIVMQTDVSPGELRGKKCATTYEIVAIKESTSISPLENESICVKENGLVSLTTGVSDVDSSKLAMDMDTEDAICMRTRARYSLASFTLDELETFLQETDEEDDLQNVDDEEEYRKFLAAVLLGEDSQNLQGNVDVDDEDEDEDNDADFELELEEALESDPDEIEERRMSRRNRGLSDPIVCKNKSSGQLNRPLRPILPIAPMGSFSTSDGKHLMPNICPPYMHSVNNGFTGGFTPHQIGQLHCLIHEHVQLLVQVFSLCALDPARGHIAAEVKELILEILRKYNQVLAQRLHPYPRFCFFPPFVHPSVLDDLHQMVPSLGSSEKGLCEGNQDMHYDTVSMSNERFRHLSDVRPNSSQTFEYNPLQKMWSSWVPVICGPVLTVLDVAPMRLIGNYIDDVSSAVRTYERYQIELGTDSRSEKEPLFPLHNSPCSAETDDQGEMRTTHPKSIGIHSSSSSKTMPKKTMASILVEKAKKQSVALVPREIAKLAQRFRPLFNSALYPHKPPPAPIANRVLFTDAEDELLALGLMEYNTDWKAIQQRFLPSKSKHQIFVRQKNRASSKAPENPIKAVRRMKNSQLNSEEIARIEVGLKKYKLDWISIWRFFVPYRDPSLLPRLWRIASGTQKSYKSDANKKAKRRLYELRRKAVRHSTLESSSEKEDNSADAVKETDCGDECMEAEDEAYVHEAFLEDWRPDNYVSLNYPAHQLSQEESTHTQKQINNSSSREIQHQILTDSPATLRPSKSQVILRPYRARRPKSTRMVKLAPDLPPVNLPPSVRVMSQSVFKRSQAGMPTKFSENSSRTGSKGAFNVVQQDGVLKNSGVDYSGKSGKIMDGFMKITASSQLSKHSDKCIADSGGDPDLQMHPLLFQASQDGRLPYYPLNLNPNTPSSFTFFSGKQAQLNLSLFHNPRNPRDAANFLSKSSKSPGKSSCGVDFHPLLQKTDDLHLCSVAALPPNKQLDVEESSQTRALITNPLYKQSLNDSASTSGRKMSTPSATNNGLDLDIHLSFTSMSQEAVESRDMAQLGAHSLVRDSVSRTAESEGAKDLSSFARDGISHKLGSNDHSLVTSRNRGRNVADKMLVEPLPEIIMEQEELSDSEEEFGEHVEFECEEMADSEGDNTSDSEQFVSNVGS